MYYYDSNYRYDDTIDVRRLQLLSEYKGMTEEEIRHLLIRIDVFEEQKWKEEVKSMLDDQRKKTMDHMAKNEASGSYLLPSESVDITKGVRIYPDLIDDQGFVSNDRLGCLNKSLRLSLDGKRKIYVQDFVDKGRAIW